MLCSSILLRVRLLVPFVKTNPLTPMGPKERALLVKLCKKQIAICVAAHKMKQYHNAPEIGQLLYGEKVEQLCPYYFRFDMVRVVKNLLEVIQSPLFFRQILISESTILLMNQLTTLLDERLEEHWFKEGTTFHRLWQKLLRFSRLKQRGIPFPEYN